MKLKKRKLKKRTEPSAYRMQEMFGTFRTDHISSMNGYMYPPMIKACSIIGKSVRNNLPSGFSGTLLEVAPNILRGYV